MAEWWEAAPLAPSGAGSWWENAPLAPEPGGLNQRAGETVTGFNDVVVAGTLGAPMDIMAFLGNQVGRGVNAATGRDIFQPREAIGGSDQIKRGMGATIGRTEPTDTLGRLLYGAGSGLGSAVAGMGVGGALRAAGRAPALAGALMGGGTPAGAAANVGLGAASGAGQVAGEELAGDNPLARTLGGMAGAMAPGALVAGGALLRGARPPMAPREAELKAVGGAGLNAAREAGIDVTGDKIASTALQAKQMLAEEGFIDAIAPKTNAVLDQIATPPPGGFATFDNIRSFQKSFYNLTKGGGEEAEAARRARNAFTEMVNTIGPDDLRSPAGVDIGKYVQGIRDANANYAAAMRTNEITGSLDKAHTGILEKAQFRADATHSGRNLDNAIRQRVASFLESPANVASLSPEEFKSLEKVVQGGFITNRARDIGNLLGGGGGLGKLATSVAGGATMGPAGYALPLVGSAAKGVENALTKRSLNAAAEMMRQNSPLYEQMLKGQQGILPKGREEEILRALMPGLLAMFGQQPPVPGLLQ